jgi:hypothetical protein
MKYKGLVYGKGTTKIIFMAKTVSIDQ